MFNFIPNSASCQWLFSEMGNVKTKKQNCLSVKQTQDCAFLKGELCCRHAEEGTACQWLKRQFGNKPVKNLISIAQEAVWKRRSIWNNWTSPSEDSDSNESDSDYVIDPVLQQKTQSRVQLVAKELIQAVDDDSNTSGSDMDMDDEPSGSLSIPCLVPKVSASACFSITWDSPASTDSTFLWSKVFDSASRNQIDQITKPIQGKLVIQSSVLGVKTELNLNWKKPVMTRPLTLVILSRNFYQLWLQIMLQILKSDLTGSNRLESRSVTPQA